MRLQLRNVRGAFLTLFKPEKVNGEGEAAYSGAFLMPPDHPDIPVLEKAFAAVAKEKWGAKADAILKQMKAQDKLALHDGDTKSNYDGFPGNMFVSTRSKIRPTVLNRDKTTITEEDGKAYSGAYYNVNIELWAQDNKYGKRINAQLRGLQFVRDGDAFSSGSAASEDEFEEVLDGAEDDPTA